MAGIGRRFAAPSEALSLGDPINTVIFIANKLGELEWSLEAGMFLMTGAIVPSVAVEPGDEVKVDFTRLGQVRVRLTD